MDTAEEATSVITDDAVQIIENNAVELTGLVAFSRQLHYLLSLITKDSTKLVVRGNLGLNGFETWHLLSRRFALPSTANNIDTGHMAGTGSSLDTGHTMWLNNPHW